MKKDLLKEARYLGIKGFSRMKKYELVKIIRDRNTKGKKIGDGEVCEKCLHEQYKQQLTDKHLSTVKLLDNALRKLSILCNHCASDRVVIDGGGHCRTLKPA